MAAPWCMMWWMRRTNIYLAEEQCSSLDELARSTGVSRAEVIRRLIDQAIASDLEDLASDLASIHESFGALGADGIVPQRSADDRMRHLQGIARA